MTILTAQGTLRGQSIDLVEKLELPEGQPVVVQIRLAKSVSKSGDGIKRCSGGMEPFWTEAAGNSIDATWEQAASHGSDGQVLLSDGSVEMLRTLALREQIGLIIASGSTNVVFSKPQGTL